MVSLEIAILVLKYKSYQNTLRKSSRFYLRAVWNTTRKMNKVCVTEDENFIMVLNFAYQHYGSTMPAARIAHTTLGPLEIKITEFYLQNIKMDSSYMLFLLYLLGEHYSSKSLRPPYNIMNKSKVACF